MRLAKLFIAAALSTLASAVSLPPTQLVKRESIISEILTDIEDATTCAACDSLLVVLKGLAALGNDAFVNAITSVCIDLGTEDSDVCTGAIAMDGPILAHDLREMTIPSHTSQLFCTTIFGLCSIPAVTPHTVTFPKTKPATSRPAVSGKTPLQVVHYSDIHVDLSYEVGASYNCTKNICCRPYNASDAPGVTPYPAGPYGNPNCDSPYSLEKSMYAAIKSLAPEAAFAIFTGDVVEGAVWLVTETEVTGDLKNATTTMGELDIQIYPVIGNHDAAPVNSFPPAAVNTTLTSQWVYNALDSDWTQFLGASTAAEVAADYGAYSINYPSGNLKIITFNSNFYYKEDFWLYETTMETDPSGQLAWLVNELQAAETAGQRVWLMGHMPMGTSDAFYDGSDYFDQIVQRYDATIAAMFFGHTHKDEFEISYSNYSSQSADTATMMSYIAPALTPTSGNPSFRVYSVDPETFGILDVTTYITNISSPTFQSGPVWEKYYSVKETYGPLVSPPLTEASAELTPAFWHNLTTVFENDDTVFQEYYGRKSRGYDVTACTGSCKTDEICQLRAAQSQYNCFTPTVGVNFKKVKRDSDGAAHAHADECSGSVASSILFDFAADFPALQKSLKKAVPSYMSSKIST